MGYYVKYILLILICTSCLMQDGFKHSFTPFYIEQGKHKSVEDAVGINVTRPSFKTEGKVKFRARFESNCFYDKSLLGSDSLDINKLFGLSDHLSKVHEHSARIGWRPKNDSIMDLFAYAYSDGNRYFKKIGEAKAYDVLYFEIDLRGSVYKFTYEDNYIELPRDKKANKGTFFRLFPYFGGNRTAPQDMTIWIKEL